MKPPLSNSLPECGSARNAHAFTIIELLTASAIFIMIVAAVVVVPIVGLKMNARAASKLQSTAAGAKALDQIRNRVLEANSVIVGNGNTNTFATTGTNGNALKVFPGTNSNYLLFFMSTNTEALYEWNSTNDHLWTLASHVTNETVFETVDFQGNVLPGNQEHYSIRMTLKFAQLDYKIPTNTYEYYTLQTEMTPRGQ